MARKLNITLRGTTFEVETVKLERKKLYGWVETRVSTPEGDICSSASLNDDGVTIAASGCVKTGIVTDDGNWAERDEFVTVDKDGNPVEPVPSSFDTGLLLDTPATAYDILETEITTVYQLDGDGDDALIAALGDEIYTFPWSYRGGSNSDAFIVSIGHEVFILAGTRFPIEYLSLDDNSVLDDGTEEEFESDDLDFSMF